MFSFKLTTIESVSVVFDMYFYMIVLLSLNLNFYLVFRKNNIYFIDFRDNLKTIRKLAKTIAHIPFLEVLNDHFVL